MLCKKRVVTAKKNNNLRFWWNFPASNNQAQQNLNQKKQKILDFWDNRVNSPLFDTVDQNFISILILYTFSLK